jgi:hypothetical protein
MVGYKGEPKDQQKTAVTRTGGFADEGFVEIRVRSQEDSALAKR